MKILVFDTCFNKTYIVFKDNDKIVENKAISSTDADYHTAFLIPEIRNILKDNNILLKDIDCIGVNTGPGSFTGIRAGITIARVFAQQADIKLAGVCSLEILSKLNNTGKPVITAVDARKNKVYFAKYGADSVLIEPMLLDKDLLIQNITKDDFVITDSPTGGYLKRSNIEFLNYEQNDEKLGLYLMETVCKRLKSGSGKYNWADVKPLYLQPPSVSKPKEAGNV